MTYISTLPPNATLACKADEQRFEAQLADKLMRHTVGRISSLVRIPIYAVGILLQSALILVKLPVSFIATPLSYCLNTKKLDGWTFTGVAIEAVKFGMLVDRTLNSALCVIFAPPEKYRSFEEACKGVYKIVSTETNTTETELSTLFGFAVHGRAQYHKQIIDCGSIASDELTQKHTVLICGLPVPSNTFIDKIKAG